MKKIKLSQKPVRMDEVSGQHHGHDPAEAVKMNPKTDPEGNPLKIDMVLEILFSFCSAKTLKNCRLVSKQWKEISLKAWRNKAILCPGKTSGGLPNIQKYLKLPQSKFKKDEGLQLQKYPFKNFRIQSSLTEYLKDEAKPVSDIARHVILRDFKGLLIQFKEFLSKFHSLEILELENCFWKLSMFEPRQPSNVKRLKILRNSADTTSGFCDWEYLFGCFKKLEALSIEYRGLTGGLAGIRRILNPLRDVRADAEDRGEIIMPLKELEVVNVFQNQAKSDSWFQNDVYMDIICPILFNKFSLERLTLHVVWDKSSFGYRVLPIYELLESYKETLYYLNTSFIFNVSDEVFNLHFQKKNDPYTLRMEKLKEVKLSNGLWGMYILAGLDLPNLEKLIVDCSECIEQMNDSKPFQLPFPESRVYEKLTTLDFLDNRKIPGVKTIRTFAKIMPNLVHLTMPLDKFTFAIICESFKGLKTLNVVASQCRYEELDDDSLTGISKGAAPGAPRKSNITDLALLTDLSVACDTELQGNAPFTDHSVICGLLHLPRLHSLSIGFKELSDENKAKLLSHVKGYVTIKVKAPTMPESYSDVEVALASSSSPSTV